MSHQNTTVVTVDTKNLRVLIDGPAEEGAINAQLAKEWECGNVMAAYDAGNGLRWCPIVPRPVAKNEVKDPDWLANLVG